MAKREKFTPKKNTVYVNQGGGCFMCLFVKEDGTAVMQNVASQWTFTAHGIGIYEDGAIDWDFSTGGYFA